MKSLNLILVILTICAFQPILSLDVISVKSDFNELPIQSRALIDDIINNLLNRAQDILKDVTDKTNKALEDFIKALTDISESALSSLQQYISNILKDINGSQDIVEDCVEQQRDNINRIIQNAREKIVSCVTKAMENGENLRKEVEQFKNKIKSLILRIQSIIDECKSNSLLQTLQCVLNQTGEIGKILREILKMAQDIIRIFTEGLQEILTNARTCITGVIIDAQNELDKIIEIITECINQNQNKI